MMEINADFGKPGFEITSAGEAAYLCLTILDHNWNAFKERMWKFWLWMAKVQNEKLLKRIDFAFRFLFCKSNHDSREGGFGQVKANLRNISSQTQPLMN